MEDSFYAKKIEADLRTRFGDGGLCGAAEALDCLSDLFHHRLEGQVLSAAAVLECDGSGCPALLGARLFIGLCGDSLAPEEIRVLDRELLRRCRKILPNCLRSGSAPPPAVSTACAARTARIVELTAGLIREKPEYFLHSDKLRPQYDTISAGRIALFRHTPYALEERLVGAVIRGDTVTALKALGEISRSGRKAVLAADPLRSAKNSIIGTIAFLARAAIRAGIDPDQVFALSDVIIRHTEELRTRKEVLDSEKRILLRFIGLVKARLGTGYSRPVQRALNYIESHLDRRLFLKNIAAAAGLHPGYLSGLFKKETGKSLTGFITLRKIQESVYFVRHTNYSVMEIAGFYGFSSQSYFIRCFKRVTGKTPGEFRLPPPVSGAAGF
ncbi:MAG: AraC family transcriptional regulator [Treponema sp.]|nr:AraC family transcriptional regulator [Treponema sp.]